MYGDASCRVLYTLGPIRRVMLEFFKQFFSEDYAVYFFNMYKELMKRIASTTLFHSGLLLTGCSIFMKGSVSSTPDPTYNFDRSAPVIVTVTPQGANSLQSKYYIPHVISAMKNNGFQKVFSENERDKTNEHIKLFVFVDIFSSMAKFSMLKI